MVTATVRRVAEHDVGGAVADEHDVDAGGVDDLGRRVVVGGDHHDRAALGLPRGQVGDGAPAARLGVGPRHVRAAAGRGTMLSMSRTGPTWAATARQGPPVDALERAPACRGRPRRRSPAPRRGRASPWWRRAPARRRRSRRRATAALGGRRAPRRRASACLAIVAARRTLRLDIARPSGSRTVGHIDDLDREVEVGHELAHDDALLRVLLAEVGDVGLHHGEQLGDDGGHAPEVLRAAHRALERLGDGPVDAHGGGETRSGTPPSTAGANTIVAPALPASSTSRASSRG